MSSVSRGQFESLIAAYLRLYFVLSIFVPSEEISSIRSFADSRLFSCTGMSMDQASAELFGDDDEEEVEF